MITAQARSLGFSVLAAVAVGLGLALVIGSSGIAGPVGVGGVAGTGGSAGSAASWESGEEGRGGVGPGGHYPLTEIENFCRPSAHGVLKFSRNFLHNLRAEFLTTRLTTSIAPAPPNPPAPDTPDPSRSAEEDEP